MSDCDGAPSCSKSVTRRARKLHRCVECGDAIRPGQTYVYFSGVWDGRPDSFSFCETCDAWRDALSAAILAIPGTHLCECFEIGGLRSALAEFCDEELGYSADGGPTRWQRVQARDREYSTVI